MGKRYFFYLLSCLMILTFRTKVHATPLPVEMEAAADHQVSAQGTYQGGLKNSWEYNFGSNRSAPNITGVVASGLIAAFRLTSLQEHEESALRAARALIQAYDRGWRNRRPVTQDIEFLAATGFVIDAARWFKVTKQRYSPQAYVTMVLEGRVANPAVAGWDIASAIRAAIAVGEIEYARGLLHEVLSRRAVWDKAKQSDTQALARGSLLWAMAEARQRIGLSPEQLEIAESFIRDLVAGQHNSGAWVDRRDQVLCTQTTAYAILGLSRWSSGKQAAAKGRTWLRRVGITDQKFFVGGRIWATTYTLKGVAEKNYNAEIQSEVMMSLATGK